MSSCERFLLAVLFFSVAANEVVALETTDPELVLSDAKHLARTWNVNEAIQRFEEASALFAATADRKSAAMSTLMAASTAYSAGDNLKARELTERALSSSTPDHSDARIVAYSLLSLISYQTGKKGDAAEWSRAAESLIGDNTLSRAKAYSHFSSGIYDYFFGDVRTASDEFQAAVALTAVSDDAFLSIQALTYAGYSQLRLGNTLQAMNRMQEALARSQEMTYERGVALAHREIGYIHFYIGNRQAALDSFRTSERLLPDEVVLERARILNAIGLVFRDFGDLGSAERYHENAEEAFEAAGYPLGALTALLNRADVYVRAGIPDQARSTYLRAQERAQSLGDEFQVSLAYEGLGRIELYGDNPNKAIELFKEALRLTGKSGTDSNTISELLGAAYELKGDLRSARDQYESVFAINERMGNTVYLAKNLFDLARLDYQEGRFEASYDRVRRSIELTEKVYAWVDSSALRRSYLGQSHHRFELLTALTARAAILSNRSEDIAIALSSLEKSRARSISEDLRFANRPATYANEAAINTKQHLLASLSAKNDLLTNMRLRDLADPEIKVVESEISEINEELDDLRTFQKRSVNTSLQDPTEFDLAAFQNETLDSNDVLIEFFLTESESYVWLADRTHIELYKLESSEEIDTAVDQLTKLLQAWSLHGGSVVDADAKYETAARELSDMILGPVAEKIKGKRLIVVPDGKLNYFPISALPMPGSESDDPILLTNEVIYQPSAQTYALLKKIGQERKGELAKDLLVFSDPVFNPTDERLTGIEVAAKKSDEPYRFRLVESFASLSRLPSSKTEAETVSNAVGRSDTFTGFEATRERLLSTNLADYRVVHLATHGFLDPERPELSSLILSRYDSTGKAIDESIRMHDIYSMKLNADLVVLSACQTGTGKEIKGEGVMGLNTAFLQSGARSVVSTLWQVEDNAANQLMKEFYGRMVSEGMSPSAALRAAQIKLYNDPQFRSPFFWAAFTVHGDAAASTPFKRDNSRLAIGIAAAVLLGLVLLIFRRRY